MRIVAFLYRACGRAVPYYANYPLRLILWKPLRKWLNVVVIPNIVFARLRVALYRFIGYRIGRNVFIGMKCYLDDVDPALTTIEDNVVISYGTYFAVHGLDQRHTPIYIKENAYVGMRCTIVSGKHGVTIGRHALIGAGSLVHKSIPDNMVAAGCPARIIRARKIQPWDEGGDGERVRGGRSPRNERQRPERSRDWRGVPGEEPREELRHDEAVRPENRL